MYANNKNRRMNTFRSFSRTSKFHKSLDMNFIIRIVFAAFNVISFLLLNYLIYKSFRSKEINQETFISSFIITYSVLGLFSEGYYVRSIIDMLSQVNDTESYFNEKLNYRKQEGEKSIKKRTKPFHNGKIEFKNVYYKYKDKERIGIEQCNPHQPGEKVALVGQIGSGKSTIIKLLMKLIPNDMGSISIGGQNINRIDNEILRESIFYIPQKPTLLNRTLYENITYGLPKHKNYETEIYETLNEMKLTDVTQVFKEKMHENVGPDGNTLSGGQRQIVWLLRAMFRKVDILILMNPRQVLILIRKPRC